MNKTSIPSTKHGAHDAKAPRVMDCSCPHEFQDSRYGKGKRLHNPHKGGKYGCTVCGKEKE